MLAARIAVALVGAVVVLATLGSAVRTMVVPRGIASALTRQVFAGSRSLFRALLWRRASYEQRDAVLAFYAPLTLLALPVVWLSAVFAAYSAMYWALGTGPLRRAIEVSGSSMFTLGYARPRSGLPNDLLVFSEAGIGVGLLALLITYLPSIYSTFSRRETAVALLETRAGAPPWGVTLIVRYHRIGWPGGFDEVWKDWQRWFADVEESHTTFPALMFFRSPQPDRSWTTAAGAVLDGAALVVAAVDGEPDPEAQLLIRAGYVCLRRLADFLDLAYDPDPRPTDPSR